MDGYETINDYSLLEQVRDAIEDIESSKTYQKIDDKLLFQQILSKMNVTSQATKERINGVLIEIQAHQNSAIREREYEMKEKSNKAPTEEIYYIETTALDNPTNLKGYQELIEEFHSSMTGILKLKTKKDLYHECSNESCEINSQQKKHSFLTLCPCVQRIDLVVSTYQKIKDNHHLWGRVAVSSIFCVKDVYGFQQLVDDFLHLRIIHLDKNELNTIEMCELFESRYCCDLKKCNVFSRHYRDRTDVETARNLYYHNSTTNTHKYGTDKANDMKNDKDIIFQQEIDKIHSYFLHSTLKFGKGKFLQNDNSLGFTQRKHDINVAAKGRSFSKYENINEKKESAMDILSKKLTKLKPISPKPKARSISCGSLEWSEIVLKARKFAHQSSFETPKPSHFRKCSTFEINTPRLPKRDSLKFAKTAGGLQSPLSSSYSELEEEQENAENYVGVSSDMEWISQINECDSDEEIYNKLVQFCGIFRWQNAHGFRSRHFQGLHHIHALFKNIKEEVLRNTYHAITIENWNQTLRKSKAFHQSWAAAKIRALYDGEFEDQITQRRFVWKQYDQIELAEIVTLKLYTDFDKLQFELKKCFRWEYTQEVIERHQQNDKLLENDEHKYEQKDDMDRISIDKAAKIELQNRLSEFYHWRQSLVVILNKYGHKIRESDWNYILYHGVNAKMILNPAQTPAFYGPLSTSSSFHVAQTFATDAGMVLTISSQYPRLGVCRAFDASLISDYPEEQEWLIGFIYTRIRKIHTKQAFEWKHLPPASNLRFVFFALHLFRMQMFSMSDDLEEILIQIFLEKNSKINQKYERYLLRNRKDKLKSKKEKEMYEKAKILDILRDKFEQFRNTPNSKQIIRLDDISPTLRKYFLDATQIIDINKKTIGYDISSDNEQEDADDISEDGGQLAKLTNIDSDYYDSNINFKEDLDGEQGVNYSVSFEKIKNIFRNVKEIHFYNYYKCDNVTLKKLIRFIEKDFNKSLKQIKFLYYDYKDDIMANPYFFDPQNWAKNTINLLTAHGYNIRHNKIMHYGYKIRIYKSE